MNSRFFNRNIYGDISTNPYLPQPTVRFDKQYLTDTTDTSTHYLNITNRQITSVIQTSKTSRVNIIDPQNLKTDYQFRNDVSNRVELPWKRDLPIKYERSYERKQYYSPKPKLLEDNLVIQPLNFLNPKTMDKSQNSKSGINLLKSKNQFKSTNHSVVNSRIQDMEKSYWKLDGMKHLAWKKCALDDNRCLGYNFNKEKENQVTVCFKGHVKRNYL